MERVNDFVFHGSCGAEPRKIPFNRRSTLEQHRVAETAAIRRSMPFTQHLGDVACWCISLHSEWIGIVYPDEAGGCVASE